MLNNTLIQKIESPQAEIKGISVAILRLDMIHPIISGNKIFKLKYYIEKALHENKQVITFGGPYSNHLVASAYAAQKAGLKATGYVRGEQPFFLSETLQDCLRYGMELKFIPRDKFNQFQKDIVESNVQEALIIPYGGYGSLGAMGAKEILDFEEVNLYNIIMASCGSGTMGAGLLSAIKTHQELLLVSAVKNNFSIDTEIKMLLNKKDYAEKKLEINHTYHFGGFAKKDKILMDYMNEFYKKTNIPTDIVYTGKLVYALNDLLKKDKFPSGSNILLIHSGGLQGNRSLKNNELIF